MNVEFVNPFITSLRNVLGTMASTELTPGKPNKKNGKTAKGDVSGLIGMVGPKVKGSFSVSFEQKLSLSIMEKMVGEVHTEINPDIIDMVGEITNMVTGGAKLELGTKGFEFEMATPLVVSGVDHTVTHKVDGPTLIMPFESANGKAYLEICFENVNS